MNLNVDWDVRLPTPARKDYRIGVVGAGFVIRDVHLPAYRKAGYNVVAIASRSPETAHAVADLYAIERVYETYQEILEDRSIEILDIAVPPDRQLGVVREAVRHGDHLKGILAHKPLAMNYAEAREIVELCQGAGIKLAVNQNMRFDQSIRGLKTLLDRGDLGEPVLATIEMRVMPHWQSWLEEYDRLTLLNMSVHHLDCFRYRFGEPERVYASARTDPRTRFRHQDGICLYILEYASGLRASGWDDVWAGPGKDNQAVDAQVRGRVEGTEGAAQGTLGWPAFPMRLPSTIQFTTKRNPGLLDLAAPDFGVVPGRLRRHHGAVAGQCGAGYGARNQRARQPAHDGAGGRRLPLAAGASGGVGSGDPGAATMMQDIGTRVRAGRKKRVGRITIQQVAEAAQVSIGTVSRVMNGRSDVDPALSRRVEAVIRELHYQPNWRAQSLVRDKSPVVSFVLSNQGGLNPVNSLLLQGIESQCAEAGYFVLFARCEYSPETPPEDLTLPSVLLVNGLTEVIIVAGLIYDNFAEALDRRGLRWVMLANHLVSGQERLAGNRVRCDDAGGCYEASRYLIHLGHRAIWHLGDASLPWFHARHQAYQRAMRENRLEPHAQTVPLSDDAFESGHSMAAVMIEKELPVTAILADSVELALGAIDALRQHGRDVPPVVVPATLVKRSTCRPFRAEAHMVL